MWVRSFIFSLCPLPPNCFSHFSLSVSLVTEFSFDFQYIYIHIYIFFSQRINRNGINRCHLRFPLSVCLFDLLFFALLIDPSSFCCYRWCCVGVVVSMVEQVCLFRICFVPSDIPLACNISPRRFQFFSF